jgi:hypothetical protein
MPGLLFLCPGRDVLKSLSGHVRGPFRADWNVSSTRTGNPSTLLRPLESMPVFGARQQGPYALLPIEHG